MKKTVLITGTSSGIGKATVFEFSQSGWNVIATQRNPEKETDFNKLPNVKMYALDVTNLESIQQVFSQAQKDFGKIDVVVNNEEVLVIGVVVVEKKNSLCSTSMTIIIIINRTNFINYKYYFLFLLSLFIFD